MNVKELIEKLKEFDENKIVHVPTGCGFVEASVVEEENDMIYIEWEQTRTNWNTFAGSARPENYQSSERMKKICEDNGFHLPILFNK